jgi:shikimate kinase
MLEKPVILTGFMGSGKSSVGTCLAELLGAQFVDLDAEIVTEAGCSINDIFARDGETAFRVLESAKLTQILRGNGNMVIATGGGVVLAEQNRATMRTLGTVVNLQVTLEQVLARLAGCSDRPLLAVDSIASRAAGLMSEREQFYADADIRIDTDGKSVEDVAAEVLHHLKGV